MFTKIALARAFLEIAVLPAGDDDIARDIGFDRLAVDQLRWRGPAVSEGFAEIGAEVAVEDVVVSISAGDRPAVLVDVKKDVGPEIAVHDLGHGPGASGTRFMNGTRSLWLSRR